MTTRQVFKVNNVFLQAPRTKMNQQRSRRFTASKEVAEKVKQIAKITDELSAKGCYVPPQKEKGEHFDRNCITPVNTQFILYVVYIIIYKGLFLLFISSRGLRSCSVCRHA